MADGLQLYRQRVVDSELDAVFDQLPAVLLDGPKGVGKTETALQRVAPSSVRRLDEPGQQSIAQADPDLVVQGAPPVLLDEWQRVPEVFDAVKRAVDRDPTGGRFLLTGSAATNAQTHSGAGRVAVLRMRPMTLPERGLSQPTVSLAGLLSGTPLEIAGVSSLHLGNYVSAIMASGFPGFQTLNGAALRLALDSYLDRIVDHDVHEAGLAIRSRDSLRVWMTAYAAATATATSWDKIRDAATPGEGAKPAKSTTRQYRDALATMRVLDDLPAWHPGGSALARLTQGPKHHLVDPGLAARLLGVTSESLLGGARPKAPFGFDGPLLGGLFESLCVQTVRVFAQAAGSRVSHLRTRDSQHEIDIVVERADGSVLALEAKLSTRTGPDDVRHLAWLKEQIGDRLLGAVVLNTGTTAYRRPDGIAVVPLALLGP